MSTPDRGVVYEYDVAWDVRWEAGGRLRSETRLIGRAVFIATGKAPAECWGWAEIYPGAVPNAPRGVRLAHGDGVPEKDISVGDYCRRIEEALSLPHEAVWLRSS